MAAVDGMRGAMIVVGVVPASLFAFVTAITLWGCVGRTRPHGDLLDDGLG